MSPSEVYSTLISEVKRKVHITPEVKDYATLVICKNSLTNFSSVSNLTFIVSKCNNVILNKFKAHQEIFYGKVLQKYYDL